MYNTSLLFFAQPIVQTPERIFMHEYQNASYSYKHRGCFFETQCSSSSATRHMTQPIFTVQNRLTLGMRLSKLPLIFIVAPLKFYTDRQNHWYFLNYTTDIISQILIRKNALKRGTAQAKIRVVEHCAAISATAELMYYV